MRFLILLIVLSTTAALLAQPLQSVDRYPFSQFNRIIPDQNNNNFYLETYHSRNHEYDGVLYAIDSTGQQLWQAPPAMYNLYNINHNASRLFDIDENYLFYIHLPGEFCNAPAYGYTGLINKSDGNGVEQIPIVAYDDAILLDPDLVINYAINDSRNKIAFRLNSNLYLVLIDGSQVSAGNFSTMPDDQDPVFWQDDTLAYLVQENDVSLLRLLSVPDLSQTDIPLPAQTIDAKVLAVGDKVLVYNDSGEAYSLNPYSGEVNPLLLPSFTDYKTRGNRIFFLDNIAHHYFWYDADLDDLSTLRTYDSQGNEVLDLNFKNDNFYLAGKHYFSADNLLRASGFWLQGQGDSVVVTSPDQIELQALVLDSMTQYDLIVPPMPNNPGYAAVRLAFSAEVRNNGNTAVSNFSLRSPESIFSGCAGNWDENALFTGLEFEPGSVVNVSDEVWVYHPVTDLNDMIDISIQGCVGRPNGNLELTYDDNCLTSNTLVISSTENPFTNAVKTLTVFPNPGNGNWTIGELPSGASQWMLSDLNGSITRSGTFQPGGSQQQLDLTDLPAGLYCLRVPTAEGVYQAKLIKQ